MVRLVSVVESIAPYPAGESKNLQDHFFLRYRYESVTLRDAERGRQKYCIEHLTNVSSQLHSEGILLNPVVSLRVPYSRDTSRLVYSHLRESCLWNIHDS